MLALGPNGTGVDFFSELSDDSGPTVTLSSPSGVWGCEQSPFGHFPGGDLWPGDAQPLVRLVSDDVTSS